VTEVNHLILRHAPVVLVEQMVYEDGEIWPDQVERTRSLDLEGEKTSYYCDCGREFETPEEAREHIEEVRQ
jgi:hypothetical protein